MNKPREPRETVNITVRFRSDSGWDDAHIRNVSSRGLMAECDEPPPSGSYIEIRRGSYVVVGRIVWAGYDRFGMRAQDRIQLSQLEEPTKVARRANDRRAAPRKPETAAAYRPSMGERQARSARFSRAFQFIAIVVIAGAAAAAVAETVFNILSRPITVVERALAG
ncbi:hypothetical protein FHS61_001927 [Altererythrobacter atlanticus]|uniref:PilZ domain-containing protein n=1 Tax=Croceibacterium atlanticum TaxID=1267766 RepID=UPI0014707524|nr:PilZ domain-containing protein [Croceibacterium atlanticum]MBB5732901.1 hypothetical protein [Croceibacterium atlanticum]